MNKLPTLLHKGTVKKNEYMDADEIKSLSNLRAIDYILKYIEKRTDSNRNIAQILPQRMGHKVIIIRSGTGSGKSTTIAPELYKAFHKTDKRGIIITQPKILTAIDKAQDMAQTFPELTLGVNVGYQTGTRTHRPKEHGILSMTPGILLNILASSQYEDIIRRISFIIIDEIHEKDINTETNLFLIKKFMKDYWKDPKCPFLILMSATFDPTPFLNYFDCPPSNFIEVEGRTFPIIPHYPTYDINNYLTYALHKALELHVNNIGDLSNAIKDIIIFVKNKSDAKILIDGINLFNSTAMVKGLNYAKKYVKSIKGGSDKYYVIPILLSRQSFQEGGNDFRNLFSDIKYLKTPIFEVNDGKLGKHISHAPASRKIIISTPIAETGITIETLKYCIDTGWVLSPEFNPDIGTEILLNKNVTKNMAVQRQGRVGRLSPGEWYPCYTKETFDSLPYESHSKFITEDITVFLLNIIINETKTSIEEVNPDNFSEAERKKLFRKHILRPSWHKMTSLNEIDFKSLDFFAPPSSSGLCYSLEKLYLLGFIDIKSNPTILGYQVNLMRKSKIEPLRMIFAGFCHNANILDLITIAAFLQVERRNVCGRKYKARNPANLDTSLAQFYSRILIADEFIDCIFIWNEFMLEISKLEKMVIDDSKIKFSFGHIQKWCVDNDIKYDGIISVIHARDEMLESLISTGINPYWCGLGLKNGTYNLNEIICNSLDEGLDEIKKIKKCILDGYRLNLAKWNCRENTYEMIHKAIPIKVQSTLTNEVQMEQKRPQIIIFSDVIIQSDIENITYTFRSSGSICVLDGFLDVDLEFTKK